jgi:hypothetical protein
MDGEFVNELIFTEAERQQGIRGVLMTIARLAQEGAERSDLDHAAVLAEVERTATEAMRFYTR